MCADKACECRKDHGECLKSLTEDLVVNVFKKIKSTKQLEDHISQVIDKLIDKLSDLRDNLILQINEKFKYLDLNKEELALVRAVENNDFEGIKGKDILNITYHLSFQSKLNQQITKFQGKINQRWKQIEQAIAKVQKSVFSEVKAIQKLMTRRLNARNYYDELFVDSKVAKTSLNIRNLIGFFEDKNLRSSKLLYRASQNGYLAGKFHQICDNIPHTIVLIETQFGKLIGGYTPVIWNKVFNDHTTDSKRRSFLFSLTYNQKLVVNPNRNQQYQVKCYTSLGPTFGGGTDLYISNKAHQNNSSYASIGYTFVHPSYAYDNQQSWKRFSGTNGTYNFRIVEWEVWQLQFGYE